MIKLYSKGPQDRLIATIYEDGKVECEDDSEKLTLTYRDKINYVKEKFDRLWSYEIGLEDDNLHYIPVFIHCLDEKE